MQLHDHFDVAHLVGHLAMDHLAWAMQVYDKARQENLLDLSAHSWPDCLSVSSRLHNCREVELKHCIQAVILFQAMMEKVPFFVPGVGSGLNPTNSRRFAISWNDLLIQISNPTARAAAQAAFYEYNTNFYLAYRHPIIHGRSAGDIQRVSDIRVPGVYEGMLQGWRAYDYLLTEAFAPQQTHERSWAIMCNAHNIEDTLDASRYPDLHALSGQFSQKHLEGARTATNTGQP